MSRGKRVFVLGVGMTKFLKPGKPSNPDYPELAKEAVLKALQDAQISYDDVEQAAVGYVYGESTSGQRALYTVGLTGIPIYNVNNNCATGSTALFLARNLVAGGLADCVLALGFERMQPGSLGATYTDRASPMEFLIESVFSEHDMTAAPMTAQMFGNAGREHMKLYGSTPRHFAKIGEKNHRHSANNPYAQFQKIHSLEEIENSTQIHSPLTKLQCSPTSDGAAAAVIVSEEFVRRHSLQGRAVEILDMQMATDPASAFSSGSAISACGADMTALAASRLFSTTGLTPADVSVIELHDCFSANELITYEALGLCGKGEAHHLVDSGDNTYGGRWVVNPSGGLISKGHPLGATGLAQCAELTWQVRGEAGPRQVEGARVGLQHNVGLGGAVVVALYAKYTPNGPQSVTYPPHSAPTMVAINAGLKSAVVFDEIKKGIEVDGAGLVKKINGVFLFKVTGGPGGKTVNWLIDLKSGNGSISAVESGGKGDATITIADEDLMDLMTGKLLPQKAFFAGKLKIAGNMALAMKIQQILPSPKSKL